MLLRLIRTQSRSSGASSKARIATSVMVSVLSIETWELTRYMGIETVSSVGDVRTRDEMRSVTLLCWDRGSSGTMGTMVSVGLMASKTCCTSAESCVTSEV